MLITRLNLFIIGIMFMLSYSFAGEKDIKTYPIVGTNQTTFYNNKIEIKPQQESDEFYGQDANYLGNIPKYKNNGDGTVTDEVTGLIWQQSFDHNADGKIDVNDKLTYNQLLKMMNDGITFAGYSDWRLPTIKEMYSLIIFSGKDTAPETKNNKHIPFINSKVFDFAYGDLANGERIIDVQCATTNVYKSNEVEKTIFGVNFADGRIKGYGNKIRGKDKKFNYLLVRGNVEYGKNDFIDNNDGTVTDKATGLMWTKDDSKKSMLWQNALKYAENSEKAGYSDWRLPDAKELQSLVDYSRSPAHTNSASIDPIFKCSKIKNEAGQIDYPWYWTSTTHISENKNIEGATAIYVAFGRSLGYMSKTEQVSSNNEKQVGEENLLKNKDMENVEKSWIDVHGAGSQRSDPKTGNPADYPEGEGPQGDAKRIYNYVRLVRDVK